MREVIERDRDFNLNTVKYSKKQKPLSKVKGKVSISLYEDDNIVRDIKTENKVMDWFKEDAYYRHYESLLGKNAVNAGYITKPTKYIVLSNKEDEESSVNCLSKLGSVIGYAERQVTYSGSDTLKGTYNINESKVYTDEQGNLVCHEVYDFPTHACNGEIKSVMWSSLFNNASSTTLKTAKNTSFGHKPSEYSSAYYDKENNEIIYIGAGAHNQVIKWNLDTNENNNYSKLVNPMSTSGFPQSVANNYNFSIAFESKDIAYGSFYNNSYYDQGGITSYNMLIVKWDLNTGEAIEYEVKNLSPLKSLFKDENGDALTSYLQAYYYNEHIYLYGNNTSTGTKGLAKFDMDFNLIKQVHFNTNTSYTINSTNSKVFFVNNKIIVKNNGEMYILDNDMTIIDYIEEVFNGMHINNMENARLTTSTSSSNYYCYLQVLINPFTTYVKLPSPITKTNVHTMKVQYDFVFEKNKAFNELLGVL